MRIAHVAPTPERTASGVQTAVEELVKALSRRGHDVELWHVGDWSPPLEPGESQQMKAAGVRFRRLSACHRPGSLLPDIDIPVVDPVDLLHVHSVFVRTNTALTRAWPGPIVVSPHGGYEPASLRRSFLRKQIYSALYEKRMIRCAAITVALTAVEAAHVQAYAGNVATAVVPNGVTLPRSSGDGLSFRSSVGLPTDAWLALFVGRLDVEHKGLDRLVAASVAAPSWRFVLVGPDHRGSDRRLRRMAAARATSARLNLVGPLHTKALDDAYAAADVFVLPSRWEGLPMSLLEALARGVPALVTPEVDRLVPVSRSRAGWVSVPSELGTTLEAVAALSAVERSKRSEAARELARSYDWSNVAAEYEEVYRAALRRGKTVRTASNGARRR